jgi:hypothetical protein
MSQYALQIGEQLLPLPEASRTIGAKAGTLRRGCRERRVVHFKLGERYLIPASEVARLQGGKP